MVCHFSSFVPLEKSSVDCLILRGSKMEDNVGHLNSPERQSDIVKAESISDCVGKSSDTNVELEKKVCISGNEVDECKAENLPGREGIGYLSSTGCSKDDVDSLKRLSSVASTVNHSVLEEETLSRVISCRNGLDDNEKSEVLAPFPAGNTSAMNSSVKSDVCSDSGPSHTTGNEFLEVKLEGYQPCGGENEVKFPVQTTIKDKQCACESSSSNSARVTLPVSSLDSCQEMSVHKSAYKNITPSAIDTSTCTNFRLEQPAFDSLVSHMAINMTKYQSDATMVASEEQCNEKKASEPIDNVISRGRGKLFGLASDNECVSGKNTNHFKSGLSKNKIAECYIKYRSETCYDLGDDDALEVALRVAKEVEQEVEASRSSSSRSGRSNEVFRHHLVDSADSHREGFLTETGSTHQQVMSDSLCSTEEPVNLKVTKKEELSLEVKELVQTIVPGTTNGWQKSSNLTIEVEDVAAGNQKPHIFRIDLNVDILGNEEEYPQRSLEESVSLLENLSKPTPVLAKSGIPLCLPVPKILSEGELGGWRGAAATSAFRPTSFSESCNRTTLSTNDTLCSSNYSRVGGIDLNIAVAGTEIDIELLSETPIPALSSNYSKESSVEVNSRRARMLDIDLNCMSENDGSSRQLSPPASIRDFDLNDNLTSANPCIGTYQTCEGTQGVRYGNSDDPAVSSLEYSRQSECKTFTSSCSWDLSTMEGFSHNHVQPFLVAAPNMLTPNEQLQTMAALQHKFTFSPQPPHAFFYNSGFCVDPNPSLFPSVYPPPVHPYMTEPHATPVIPQYFGSSAVPVFRMAPHLTEAPRRSGPFDLNMGANSLENGSRGMHARQLCVPLSNTTLEEQMQSFQQVGLNSTAMKRREPDGGWDSHQRLFRNATSWL